MKERSLCLELLGPPNPRQRKGSNPPGNPTMPPSSVEAAPEQKPSSTPVPFTDWTWSEGYQPNHDLLTEFARDWPDHFVWSGDNTPDRWQIGFWVHAEDKDKSAMGVVFGHRATNSFGNVQGGAISSMFDAAMLLSTVHLTAARSNTAFLNVTFRRPVQLRHPYIILSECRRDGRKLFVTSVLRDAEDNDGEEMVVFAEAEALFILPRPESRDPAEVAGSSKEAKSKL